MSLIEEEDPRGASNDQAQSSAIPNTHKERSPSRDSDMGDMAESPSVRYLQQPQIYKASQQALACAIPRSSGMERGHSPVRTRLLRQKQSSKERDEADARSFVSGSELSPVRSRQPQQRQKVDCTVIQGSSSVEAQQPRATRKLSPKRKDLPKTDLSTRTTLCPAKATDVAESKQAIASTTRKRGQLALNETLVFDCSDLLR